jgi:predicted membrane channel-forming protein YqfA (hemolysin III family)
MMQPSWRKPAGVLMMLAGLAVYAVLIASLSGWIGKAPVLVQAVFYLIAGIVWVLPLKPLLRWMESR